MRLRTRISQLESRKGPRRVIVVEVDDEAPEEVEDRLIAEARERNGVSEGDDVLTIVLRQFSNSPISPRISNAVVHGACS